MSDQAVRDVAPWPFACCEHCGCGTSRPARDGHAVPCRVGCNDPRPSALSSDVGSTGDAR